MAEFTSKNLISSCDPLELSTKRPDLSARIPVSRGQKWAAALIPAAVCVLAYFYPLASARSLIAFITVFYLFATVYRLVLVCAATRPGASYNFSATEISVCRKWPKYSILVPMYREPETVPQMVDGLRKLDYPPESLDVQLLLEADDTATIEAACACNLPRFVRITKIPPSFPRTKPKACNIGLHCALGEYLVIYDAEDRPEPDQLKKAVLAFEASAPKTACVQSRLNYYNPRHNLLTRWFAADYSAWFDLSLPGLSAMRTVIPLGGTSNHFKTGVLRGLMGWDAYNVTEDCDLGVRLARAGYETRMLHTTTWEEACGSLPFWLRQRTRWQKGYIQTLLVHTRSPARLLRELGLINTALFLFLVGGSIFSALVNPFFWVMTLCWFLFRPPGIDALFPGWIFAASAICLFLGNFVFFYVNLLGCYKRRYDDLMWANLLTPAYWVLMSVSAWRALLQFFTNPFHWEKTRHGLSSPEISVASALSCEVTATTLPKPLRVSRAEEVAPSTPAPASVERCTGLLRPRRVCYFYVCDLLSLLPPLALVLFSRGYFSGGEAAVAEAVAREVLTGGAAGRQALVGSLWRAPVPTLFMLPFASLLPENPGGTQYAALAASFVAMALAMFFLLRRAVLPTDGLSGTRRFMRLLVPLATWVGSFVLCFHGGRVVADPYALVTLLISLAATLKLADWRLSGYLRDWVKFCAAFALLPLCGLRAFWTIAAALVLFPILIAFSSVSRMRFQGLALLALTPFIYSLGVWILTSFLVLGDPFYPIRGVEVASLRQSPWGEFASTGSRPSSIGQIGLSAVAEHVTSRTKYGRVFVCGYDGLALISALPNEERGIFEPCLDIHIDQIRRAYSRQNIYFLVPAPYGAASLDSVSWRCRGLYDFGLARLLYCADFGDWRLYELISAEE